MSLAPLRFAVVVFTLFALYAGCGENVKYQAEYRGNWQLESRTSPQGQEINAPNISGQMTWFPISQDKAHLMITQTDNRNAIQMLDAVITLAKTTFTQRDLVQIGGTLGAEAISASYNTTPQNQEGKIAPEDGRTTLIYDNNTHFEFIGAQLVITYPDGITDHWKRIGDEKGALAN